MSRKEETLWVFLIWFPGEGNVVWEGILAVSGDVRGCHKLRNKESCVSIWWVKKRVAVNSLPCANQAQGYRESTSNHPGQWARSRKIASLLAPAFVRPENLGGVVSSESPASGCFLVLPGSHSAGISLGFHF